MNCPLETRGQPELLVAYCSRGLDAAQAAWLEMHLEECPACKKFVTGQQAVWQVLDAWEAAPLSPDFNRRLYQRIDREVSWWQRLMRPIRPLLTYRGVPVAATAALLVVAGALLDRPSDPPPTPVHSVTAQVEPLQPEQVVKDLDQMEVLVQFNHSLKVDRAEPQM